MLNKFQVSRCNNKLKLLEFRTGDMRDTPSQALSALVMCGWNLNSFFLIIEFELLKQGRS
jgi:hypothetical protein